MAHEILPRASDRAIEKTDRDRYYREVQKSRSQFPFPAVRGKLNPYNHRIVQTENDYDLYIHSYALMRLYEEAASRTRSEQANRLSFKQHLAEYETRVRRKIWFLRCVAILLAVLLCISFMHPRTTQPPPSSYSAPASSSVSPPEPQSSGKYIGNRNTKKFHRSSCSYLPDPENRTYFSTAVDARDAGYDPCKKCNP